MTEKFSLEERVDYLKEHGSHCMAYSTLQPGMRYFDLNGVGYLGYMEKWGTRFVLGDPVSGKNNYEKIIGEALKEHKDTCFVQTSKDCAEVLKDFGFYNTQMGVETVVPIGEWNLKGKKKQNIRTAINQAKINCINVFEENNLDWENQISNFWFNKKKEGKEEVSFLVRPAKMDYQKGVRKFFSVSNEGDPLGFVCFDPLYSKGKVFGYVPNICREKEGFKQGSYYLIVGNAIEKFKQENLSSLNLGLSPFSFLSDVPLNQNNLFKKFFKKLYDFNLGYNYKGLEFTKSRFDGQNVPTYLSHKRSFPMKEVYSIFSVSKII